MTIRLTDAAEKHVVDYVAKNPSTIGIRLGVKRSGCSGWKYVVDLVDAAKADDTVFEQGGIKIYVDGFSLGLVDGTEIDFVRKGLGHEFAFVNPNVRAECGCGESFSIDKE